MFKKKRKISNYQFRQIKRPILDSRFKRGLATKKSPFFAKIKKIAIIAIFTVTIIFSIYSVFFSSAFKIKNIIISNKDFSNDTIGIEIKNSLKSYMGKSIFWLNLNEIGTNVISQSLQLQTVKVTKEYPDTISIEFSEYPLVANVINKSSTLKKTYLVNSLGFAVKEDFEKTDLPYITIQSDEPINPKNAVIDKTKLKYILDSITYFEDKFGMKVKEVLYKPIPREIHILTDHGFYLWLDIQRPFEDQLKKLKKIIVKLDIYKEPLEYIDLRIAENSGDKIIYKRKH